MILVNGEEVPQELIDFECRRLSALDGWETIEDSAEREALLNQSARQSAIDRVILRQQVEKDSRPIDEELLRRELDRMESAHGCRTEMRANLRSSIETAVRQERILREIAGPPPNPRPEDVRAFYDANLERLSSPEQVRAAHIVCHVNEKVSESEALQTIGKALVELDSGQPFAAVAERYSDCKGAGGDLGYFSRGVMVDEFDEVVFALKTGQRSGIFRTPFGFHLAEVRDRRPAGTAPFPEVAGEVRRTLVGLLDQRAMEQALQDLRAGATIKHLA